MCVCVCLVYLPISTLQTSPLLLRLIKVRLKDTSSSSSQQQMDRRRAIIFHGVPWRGVTVYVIQWILLKSRSPSFLNSGLISSLPSCCCAEASEWSQRLLGVTGLPLSSWCLLGLDWGAVTEKKTVFMRSEKQQTACSYRHSLICPLARTRTWAAGIDRPIRRLLTPRVWGFAGFCLVWSKMRFFSILVYV